MTDAVREVLFHKLSACHAEVLRQGLTDAPQALDQVEQREEDIFRTAEVELVRRLRERRE